MSPLSAAWRHGRQPGGQSLVEFSLVVPGFMLILLGLLEFGLIFNNYLTLEYATREGARTGSAMANGGNPSNSAADSSLPLYAGDPTTVDPYVIAAVQRVLESNGSPITPSQITAITITKYGTSLTNTWIHSSGAGPAVDGQNLDFVQSGATQWADSARNNGTSPDSIVVGVTYTYQWVTPLASVLRLFGGAGAGQTTLSDSTTMALNPFQ